MQYSLPTIEPLAARWRTATFVAAGVAALELVVILVIATALTGQRVSRETRAPKPPPLTRAEKKRLTTAPAGATKLPRPRTTVVVLNGNGRTGAAASMADLVRARGYRIGSVGNAPRTDYARSIVMYRRGYRAEAARLAKDMRIPIVAPLDGLPRRELAGAHAALVIGS